MYAGLGDGGALYQFLLKYKSKLPLQLIQAILIGAGMTGDFNLIEDLKPMVTRYHEDNEKAYTYAFIGALFGGHVELMDKLWNGILNFIIPYRIEIAYSRVSYTGSPLSGPLTPQIAFQSYRGLLHLNNPQYRYAKSALRNLMLHSLAVHASFIDLMQLGTNFDFGGFKINEDASPEAIFWFHSKLKFLTVPLACFEYAVLVKDMHRITELANLKYLDARMIRLIIDNQYLDVIDHLWSIGSDIPKLILNKLTETGRTQDPCYLHLVKRGVF